jgi:hypothetical protein
MKLPTPEQGYEKGCSGGDGSSENGKSRHSSERRNPVIFLRHRITIHSDWFPAFAGMTAMMDVSLVLRDMAGSVGVHCQLLCDHPDCYHSFAITLVAIILILQHKMISLK